MQPLLYVSNPSRRRGKRKSKSRKSRKGVRVIQIKTNPTRKRRSSSRRHRRGFRGFRRNPIRIAPAGFFPNVLAPSIFGAGGALVVDIAVGSLPIPTTWLQGYFAPLTKMAVALGIATIGGRITKRGSFLMKSVGVGAFTCALHDLARSAISRVAPNVKLGEFVTDGLGGLNLNTVPVLALPQGGQQQQLGRYQISTPPDRLAEFVDDGAGYGDAM